MRAEQYQKIYQWFMARPVARRCLLIAYKGLPVVVVLAYFALLEWHFRLFCTEVYVGWGWDIYEAQDFFVAIGMPAFVFLLGTGLRKVLDTPRPYQQEGVTPLIVKDKIGQACPSRHVLSASVIALAWWMQNPVIGFLLFCVAVLIAVLRVLAGVHSIRDVVMGLAFGVVVGLLITPLLNEIALGWWDAHGMDTLYLGPIKTPFEF